MKFTTSIRLFLIGCTLFSAIAVWGQVANDECEGAIEIIDIANACSEVGEFTNEGATPTGFSGGGGGLSNDGRDVWFKFTALANNVTITVIGESGGGTLDRPEVELMVDNQCMGSFSILESGPGNNSDVVELNQGGLIPGATYLFRVQGRSGSQGSFQLCVNNFFPPAEPGNDLVDASMLCGKTPFSIEKIEGTGADPDEARGTCLDVPGSAISSEQDATWFTWIAENDGTLEFTLFPINPTDDLDFVVFELPNGINNSEGKIPLRCMAAACIGPTGLSEDSRDEVEDLNCDPGEDNFVRAVDMEEGKAYGLLINNFSESGNGFSIEFGGTGNFQGPEPEVEAIIGGRIIQTETICAGEQVEFNGANSRFVLGEIEEYEWIFGVGANPQTATGINPGPVTYNEPGVVSVVLTITTDLGCKISEIREAIITVEPCCDINNIEGESEVTNAVCGAGNGGIEFSANSASPIFSYEWNDGIMVADRPDLEVGDYEVTVTNFATCTETFTFRVDSIPPFEVDTLLSPPTCNGGTNGVIELDVTSQVDITYAWGDGSSDSSIDNLSIGTYLVTIEDANGCSQESSIELNELTLEIDPTVEAVNPPNCFGEENGSIVLDVVNGESPYEYNWNDGRGFVGESSLTNLGANVYNVNIVDRNGCQGVFEFNMEAPPALELMLEAVNVSCAGQGDGVVTAVVSGGTGDYRYDWSSGQSDEEIAELIPGSYTITVLDENDCSIMQAANIIEPSDIQLSIEGIEDVVCFGESTGVINLLTTGGNPDFEYSVDGGPFEPSSSISNLPAGTYSIAVRDMRGCTEDIEATVEQPQELIVDIFAENEVVDLGRTTVLETTVSPSGRLVDYSWSMPELLDCSDCPNPSIMPLLPGNFTVTITDIDNCTATDSIFLNVRPNRELYIPNIFSPNFDGINDRFDLYGGISAQEILLLRIFDRWGNMVYEQTSFPLGQSGLGWDGQFNGQDAPIGVYAFYARVLYIDGAEEEFEGDITIIR